MSLKLAQFCDDPQKISTKSSYPQKIFKFLKAPKNIEIQNFEPKKMGRAYVCVKISEYPLGQYRSYLNSHMVMTNPPGCTCNHYARDLVARLPIKGV